MGRSRQRRIRKLAVLLKWHHTSKGVYEAVYKGSPLRLVIENLRDSRHVQLYGASGERISPLPLLHRTFLARPHISAKDAQAWAEDMLISPIEQMLLEANQLCSA